ncbi:MAG: aminotransferase class V-fold PLP-dependent enzyme [Lachnospiraceae bacterium]|nr:aminotransferase class V-fold PLP-dependent enzyme [Lachnospiraceae bacterium]
MIYLDNAATTMHKPQAVIDAVAAAMSTFGNASRGAHEGALTTSRVIYRTRAKLAAFFGCPKSEQVIFTCNATEALNIALTGLFHAGDHVISTELEHNSVLRPLYRIREEQGVSLDFVPADKKGCVDYADFERLIRPETRAIVCTHASNLTGNRLDIGRIGKIAEAHGLLFVVDASQTAGAARIDMEEMKISVLCFTGHKSMMGPQGTGGLCIRGDVPIRSFKVGGSGVQSFLTVQPPEYPTHLEAGTLNGHGIAGLSAAVDFIQSVGRDTIEKKETALMMRFYRGVSEVPGVTVYGDFSTEDRSPIVSLNMWDLDSAMAADELAQTYGIATRAGAHCAPLMHRALGTEEQGAVRFSFNWFNTEEEVDEAVSAVREIAEWARP